MAKKSPKSPLSEEERAALANAGAIADKAMEEIQGEPAPEASPAASEPPSGAEEVSGTVDHSIPVETDTPEKVAQRKLLKVKMDLMKVKEAELTDLYADIESAVKETKELRRVIRETAKDIAMFVTNITGVKTSARPGKVRTGKVIVAPGGKAIGRQPTVSMRGKVIVPLKTDVNPNRSGSLRAGAYEIIMRNPNGIAISEYQKAGGRYPDIKFFLLKGFIKLEYPNYGIEEAEETGSETEAVPATETEATTESATV